GPNGSYDYNLFLDHIKKQYENKQARQTAGNLLQLVRMGSSQYLVDYLQDFELKVAQYGEISDYSKIMHLDTGINARLRLLLLRKSLPDDNYLKWVNRVKAVAGRLENTQSYRTAGGTGKNTWYVPQNGAKYLYTKCLSKSPTASLQAALNAFGEKTTNNKPSAPWRTPQEFKRLSKEGKCIRYASKSHNTRACPRFRAARKPDTIAHIQHLDSINSPVGAI
ncbi:putative eka-like protein, partial [Erysiphe neolycopersici]